jgi:hypothetical protein
MILQNMGRRIIFELLFFVLFPILMIFHICWAFVLLVIECFKVYPHEIYKLVKNIVYGQDS